MRYERKKANSSLYLKWSEEGNGDIPEIFAKGI